LHDFAVYDPVEDRLRPDIRVTIEMVLEKELTDYLVRLRYGRRETGCRAIVADVLNAGSSARSERSGERVADVAGKTAELRSQALPRYQRLTRRAKALIAAVYLSRTNTRRVKRALSGLLLLWSLLAVGQMQMRKADGWENFASLFLDGTIVHVFVTLSAEGLLVVLMPPASQKERTRYAETQNL